MRGKASHWNFNTDIPRITPAYAGKSCFSSLTIPPVQDHPRLCGEKKIIRSGGSMLSGSPPPMRGKGCLNGFEKCRQRITPAYAGKSHLYGIITVEVRDHPRLCGEKGIVKTCNVVRIGSPPPMRGKEFCLDFSKVF